MTGTPCDHCGSGWLVVVNSRRTGGHRVKYHACWMCGRRPPENKTIEAVEAPKARQRRRVRAS